MSKTVCFLGSKKVGYECLKHLIDNSSNYGITVGAVISNNRSIDSNSYDFQRLAESHNITYCHEFDNLSEKEYDFFISVQYHKILTFKQLQFARTLSVNLHMAPLPEYRGCNQFSFAILNQDRYFGTTLHIMDKGIDCGDIIAESRFEIPNNCSVGELIQLTIEKSISLFHNAIGEIFSGSPNRIPQSSLIAHRGTSLHYRNEINRIKVIPKNADREVILRTIRATYLDGFEPPYSIDDQGVKYYIPDGKHNFITLSQEEYESTLR